LNRHSEILRELSYKRGSLKENNIRIAQYGNVAGEHVLLDTSTYREIFHRNYKDFIEHEIPKLNEKVRVLLLSRIDMTDIVEYR
jgi:hypothetical protein